MLTKSVVTPKPTLQFPLDVEMITSSSKNAGMLQFMKDTAMVEVLHFSPGEFKPPHTAKRDGTIFKPDLLR